MNNKVVASLMDAMRSGPESLSTVYERALQILAWASLSERHEVDQDLSLDVALGADDAQLGEMITALSERDSICDHAFSTLRGLKRDALIPLRAGMQQCQRMQAQGLLSGLSDADLPVPSVGPEYSLGMPAGVADLLLGLALDLGNSIYVGWDSSGQLTARALRKRARVHCDVQSGPAFPCLSGLIAGGSFTVSHTNPIRAPGAVAQGRLTKFSSAVAFPPIGLRYDAETAEGDFFGRFPEKTTLSSVLSIRHLMAVADSRVIVCVPNGFLFGANAERELRKSLIEKGQLRAVVALPPGLLSIASIAVSMLVLSPAGGERSVRVVNADDERFRRMTSKTRSELTDIEAIIHAANGHADGLIARDVPADEIVSNDYQLQVARYLIPDEQKRVLALLENAQLVPLGELVEVIRPPVVKSKDSASITLREVGVGDLPTFGYIDEPQRSIDVDEEMAKKLSRYHLRPLDVVLAIKGSVGKIGLVPPTIGDSNLPWVVGQSSVALRVKSPNIRPSTLFMLLRSSLGQALIKSIVSAGTIPFIQTRELEALSIPVPSLAEQDTVANVLDQEARVQDEIRRLQDQLAQLSKNLWSI